MSLGTEPAVYIASLPAPAVGIPLIADNWRGNPPQWHTYNATGAADGRASLLEHG